MKIKSFKCTHCGCLCLYKQNQFTDIDGTYFPGFVCIPCKALFVDEDNSILKHIETKVEVECNDFHERMLEIERRKK